MKISCWCWKHFYIDKFLIFKNFGPQEKALKHKDFVLAEICMPIPDFLVQE